MMWDWLRIVCRSGYQVQGYTHTARLQLCDSVYPAGHNGAQIQLTERGDQTVLAERVSLSS